MSCLHSDSCWYSLRWISNAKVFCPSSKDKVVFRAKLELQNCFQEYLRYYEYWAIGSMYPILQLEANNGSQVLLVDRSCPIYTSSLDTSECLSSDPCFSPSNSCISASDFCISASVAGGIAAGMLFVGILLSVAVILFCVLARHYKVKRSKKCKKGEDEKYEDVRRKKIDTSAGDDPQYMTISDVVQKKESVVNIGGVEYLNPNGIMDRENLTDSSHRTATHCRYTETKPTHQQRTKQLKKKSNTNQALPAMKEPAMRQPVVKQPVAKQPVVEEQPQAASMGGSGQKLSAGGSSGKAALERIAEASTSLGFHPTTSPPSHPTAGPEKSIRYRAAMLNQTDRFSPSATAAQRGKPVGSTERESAPKDKSFLPQDTTRQVDGIPRKK